MIPLEDLPTPDGTDPDGRPWWRLCSGERVYAVDGHVFMPDVADLVEPGRVECDALAVLAACAWARIPQTNADRPFA